MLDPNQWSALVARLSICRTCHDGTCSGLAESGSRPLFVKVAPRRADLLFIAEAPNVKDTFDSDKGYLTVDPKTDPSGAFFHELYSSVLGEEMADLAVTNAALCLPRTKGGAHPVSGQMLRACQRNLRDQIDVLNPLVVVTLGGVALRAARGLEDHGLSKLADLSERPIPWFGRLLSPRTTLAHSPETGRPAGTPSFNAATGNTFGKCCATRERRLSPRHDALALTCRTRATRGDDIPRDAGKL